MASGTFSNANTVSLPAPGTGNTTLYFAYTAPSAKVQSVALDAVSQIAFEAGDNISGMTNAEKLAYLESAVRAYLLERASHWHVQSAKQTAEQTSTAETATLYGLTL